MTAPVAIGASGIMGLGIEQLAVPSTLAGAPAAGGALTAGIYKYVITALSANGETPVSNEITVTTSAGNLTAALTWSATVGATGYNIYRTAASGGTGTELLRATVGAVLLYNDVAVGVPIGSPPSINTAMNYGVYTIPTKFVPFLNESLVYSQATMWRRPIRNTPGLVGAEAGWSHIEGTIQCEALMDVLLYFLKASRCTMTKTGGGPYTYTFTPAPIAVPAASLSITILRNGQTFGYTGCVVHDLKLEVASDGTMSFTATILGSTEASQAAMTGVTWPTTVPIAAGMYSLQIPTATQVFDTDTFSFESNDNGTPEYRMQSTGTGASFISFGESDGTINVARDFSSRTEYDAFKALTAKSITLVASQNATTNQIAILAPVAIVDTYTTNIGAQGDLIRATIAYQCAIDGTGKHYQLTLQTTESIT
jgi:hypothetical protein